MYSLSEEVLTFLCFRLQIIQFLACKLTKHRGLMCFDTVNYLILFQLLYLRIVSMLFSTSDFRHVVCTPAMVLLSQVLAQVVMASDPFYPKTSLHSKRVYNKSRVLCFSLCVFCLFVCFAFFCCSRPSSQKYLERLLCRLFCKSIHHFDALQT